MNFKIFKNPHLIKVLFLILSLIILNYTLFVFLLSTLTQNIALTILDYFRVLIWPGVIIYTISIFKSNISNLIERIVEWSNPFIGNFKIQQILTNQTTNKIENIEITKEKDLNLVEIIEQKGSEINSQEENKQILLDKLARAEIELDFERIYNLIFASQIDLLIKINSYIEVEFEYVLDHFKKVQLSTNNIFNNWNYIQYSQFLIDNHLIIFDYETYKSSLTLKGKAFLNYLTLMNYKKYGI